ncbi:MAG: phage protein Gp27 family protein [Ruthenibacterium sp.]
MARQKNRAHGKIRSAPEIVHATVDQMLESGSANYRAVVEYMASQGISISQSAVCRYARSFQASVDTLRIAHENFKYLYAEVERHPDLDFTEVLTRVSSQHLLDALMSRPDEAWDAISVEKLIGQISGLTNAVAYKKRVESQNKDKYEAAIDEVRTELFRTLSAKRPDLYREITAELGQIQRERITDGR